MRDKKGITHRAVVIADSHYPFHDKPTERCIHRAIDIVRPDMVIHLGDIIEGQAMSHWQWKKKRRPPFEYQQPSIDKELYAANMALDELDLACDKAKVDKKILTVGNHDDWADRLAEYEARPEYQFVNAMRLADRGWKVTKIGKKIRVGRLHFYHGHHHGGVVHSRTHLMKMGCNIMYGHYHDIQWYTVTHIDGPKAAFSMPCVKSLEGPANEWLQDRGKNWQNGFAIVDWFGSGDFTVDMIVTIRGRCSLWGELIDGNKKTKEA